MDYEKKYNEALERARKAYNAILPENHGARKIIEDAFPELRESEDERIRKEILDWMKGGNTFDWQKNKEKWIAYLERLKENPKSADSIPSDCVSDAKCEDRWHKVGDSLPDNPREVLCKDEAGNYFIGRYYVGEGWEISNYDDEDKPHHLNPPVSKWIDFPSEKQKEQKPEGVYVDCTEHPEWYGMPAKEQKPSEWGDTNELVFQDICKHLKEEGFGGWVVLLNALRNGEFQFKQEWSKEDENVYESIQTILLAEARFVEERKWFNSIKARIKSVCWDEKDEKMRDRLIDRLQFITLNTRTDTTSPNITFFDEIAWLKSIRPSWKPSEEQMRALKETIDFAPETFKPRCTLITLQNCLEKLI